MTTPGMTTVELTADEVRLVHSALHLFLSAFGHDEADMVHAVRDLLAKLPAAHSATASTIG